MLRNPAQTRQVYIASLVALAAACLAIGAIAALHRAEADRLRLPASCLSWERYVELPPYKRDACELLLEMRAPRAAGGPDAE